MKSRPQAVGKVFDFHYPHAIIASVRRLTSSHTLALVAVILVAAILRFAGLGHLPAGLYRDEAFYGLDAVDVLHGQHAIYFPANNGREPMFIYILAASIGMLGRGPFAVRLPAAIISLLTVPVTYRMARELFGERVGLVTAAVLTVTLWPVHLAHIGYRVGLLPLFAALTVWQAARAWRTQRALHWIAAGVLYGLCFYTYLAVRFSPLVIAAFVLYVWFTYPRERPGFIRASVLFALAAFVVAAPLAIYALGHWDIFMGRGEQVTIFNPSIGGPNPWLTLASNVVRAVSMFFWRGDFIARHNVPYRPVFDPLASVLFIAGVIFAFVRAKRNAACALALIWTAVMLVPTILAEDTPHFLRAVGVLPVIAVFPAVAVDWLANKPQVARRKWAGYVALPMLAVSLAFTGYDYFVRYARDGDVRFWFDDAGAQMAAEINRFTGTGWTGGEWIVPDQSPALDHRVFVDRGLWDSFVNTQFFVSQRSALTFVKTGGDLPAPGVGPALLVLWPYQDWQRDLALLPHQSVIEFRNGALAKGDRDTQPVVAYLVVRAEPYRSAPQSVARFQNGVQLVSVQIVGARVRLMWYAPQTPDADYVVFVHAMRDGAFVVQHDGDPASGFYPMSQWRPGDMVVDEHPLPGTWEQAVVGLYRRDTLQRVPVVDAAGHQTGDSVNISK